MLRCCCRNFFIQFPEITAINFKQFYIPDFFKQFPELFEIVKASVDLSRDFHLLTWPLPDLQNACRFIRYHFGPEHLGRLGKHCASAVFFCWLITFILLKFGMQITIGQLRKPEGI